MAYDEIELDMLGDQRTAMFVIISDENAFGKAAGKQGVRGTPQHPAVCS